MCHIYTSTPAKWYESTTRSVRIEGVVTSIRLENHFWQTLDQIAHEEGRSTPKFLSELYREVIEEKGQMDNFSSLLRVICSVHAQQALPA